LPRAGRNKETKPLHQWRSLWTLTWEIISNANKKTLQQPEKLVDAENSQNLFSKG